ncbi:MAG: nucleoside recognition domain-containing protein [Clostridiaceae bacterium]
MEYIEASLIGIIFSFVIFYGIVKKVNIYHVFIQGAVEGLKLSYRVFPPILAMILAYKVFSDSRLLGFITKVLTPMFLKLNFPPQLLPLIIIKPLSGSGSLGVFTEILKNAGPDSRIGIMAALIMGSTETIFYTLTVYIGGIKAKKSRHAIIAAVFTELIAVVITLFYCNIMLY